MTTPNQILHNWSIVVDFIPIGWGIVWSCKTLFHSTGVASRCYSKLTAVISAQPTLKKRSFVMCGFVFKVYGKSLVRT